MGFIISLHRRIATSLNLDSTGAIQRMRGDLWGGLSPGTTQLLPRSPTAQPTIPPLTENRLAVKSSQRDMFFILVVYVLTLVVHPQCSATTHDLRSPQIQRSFEEVPIHSIFIFSTLHHFSYTLVFSSQQHSRVELRERETVQPLSQWPSCFARQDAG